MTSQPISLRELREEAERELAHEQEWATVQLALVEAVEAAQAHVEQRRRHTGPTEWPRLIAALARFKDYGADRDGDER